MALVGRKTLGCHSNCVRPRREVGKAVVAASVCVCNLIADQRRARDHNMGVRNDGAAGIFDSALEASSGLLAENGGGKQQQRKYLHQSEQQSILIVHRILQQGRLVVSGKS